MLAGAVFIWIYTGYINHGEAPPPACACYYSTGS